MLKENAIHGKQFLNIDIFITQEAFTKVEIHRITKRILMCYLKNKF